MASEPEESALSQMATRLAMWTKGCDAKDNSTMVAIGTGDAVKLTQMVAELANLHFDAMGKPNYYDTFRCAMKWREIAEGEK